MSGGTEGIRGSATRFKPGHATWNKGISWNAGGRSAETRFKKGRPASEAFNYAPIGSHRVTKDGYLEEKITDDPNISPSRRWVAVHRLIWESANGPIPAKHIVVFKPGMRTINPEEITIEKVECISRAENMRRNSYHQYGPEIASLIQLRGAIARQINKQEKMNGNGRK